MTRSFTDRILGGVCGGLARWTPLNVWLWRVLWLLFAVVTNGAAAVLYVLLWWLFPLDSLVQPPRGGFLRGVLALALAVAVIGGWFLRAELVSDSGASLYEPLLLLLGGVVLLLRQFGRGRTNLVPALVVVGVAIIWALNANAIIPAGIADLIQRGWPALLVFVGLAVFLRERIALGGWIALGVSLILVGGITTLAFSIRSAEPRDDQTVSIAETVSESVSELVLEITTRGTAVEFLAVDNDRELGGEFVGSTESVIIQDYREEGGRATYSLTETLESDFPSLEAIGRGRLLVEVPASVPAFIIFRGEDGDAVFNLGDSRLERLNIELLQGDALVTLPDYRPLSPPQQQNPALNIRAGSLTVFIPQDVAGRFQITGNRNVGYDDTRYLLTANGVLETRNYDTYDIQLVYDVAIPNGQMQLEILP